MKTDPDQTVYLETAEEILNLNPTLMAKAMAIPYNSYKDLRNGRRALKPFHRRMIELLKIVECGGVKEERKALTSMRKEFAQAKVDRAARAREDRWAAA
jgi:hypothetical protein